jgi:spore maturation protein CgeB
VNCEEALYYGAKHASILMPYFIPWRDRPILLTNEEAIKYCTDIVFIGHFENDGRDKFIKEILSNGFNFKLYGGKYWNKSILGEYYEKLSPIQTVEGEDYTKALQGSKICLCFLSKLNRDQYTRRCFEIPASRKLLLSQRTEHLCEIFEENVDACFFSSVDELIEKINWLLNTPGLIDKIAESGYKKITNNNYDVYSRVNDFLKEIKN